MENTSDNEIFEVAEIQLIYKSKVKASLRPKISSPGMAADVLRKYWDTDKIEFIEQFKVLLLDRSKRVIGMYEMSTGSTTGTTYDPKLVFVAALKANAHGLIVAHNHPSGSLKPSQADIDLTDELKEWGNFLRIPLLDHIILTSESHFSFASEGFLWPI
jgi:DNA repair protein RadC